MKQIVLLFVCVIGVLLIGGIGSLATTPAIESWYQYLDTPPLNPPDWIFGPVWSALYVMIGASLYFLITAGSRRSKMVAYLLFAVQLALNLAWSLVFFRLQSPSWALVVIIVLLGAIVWYMDEARDHSRLATWLCIPSGLWTLFATYLTIGILLVN